MIVFGDIGGNYKTLKKLVGKIGKSNSFISLGDMIDRGPDSKSVIDFFIQHQAILGNHEHMMIDFYKRMKDPSYMSYYRQDVWISNGGKATIESYNKELKNIEDYNVFEAALLYIDKEHVKYLESLPKYYEYKNFILTHAPIHPRKEITDLNEIGKGFCFGFDTKSELSVLWNRVEPEKRDKIQIYGHNSAKDVLIFTEHYPSGIYLNNFLEKHGSLKDNLDKIHSICLDTVNEGKKLTALNLDTMEIYQEDVID